MTTGEHEEIAKKTLDNTIKLLDGSEQIKEDVSFTKDCLDTVKKDFRDLLVKVVYAIVAIALASFGLKFIGTPFIVDLSTYLALIAGVFLTGFVATYWKQFTLIQKLIRASFALFMVFSAAVKIWVFHPGVTSAPVWFTPANNILFIVVAFLLILAAARDKPDKGSRV